MKHIIFYFFLLPLTLFGQITTQTKIIKVPCCNNSDSIDYDHNRKYDIIIQASNEGDNSAYFVISQNDIEIHEQIITITNY